MDITVIGDVCLDTFVYGDINRKSPEANCDILSATEEVSNFGMAYNVARNFSSIFPESTVRKYIPREICKKKRFVDNTTKKHLLRVDDDCPAERFDYEQFIVKYKQHPCDAILISDYNKGFLEESDIEKLSSLDCLTFLDTKKKSGSWADKIDFIKINHKEYLENFKHNRHNYELIVTQGSGGSTCVTNGRHAAVFAPKRCVDVTGAGDTYLAAFSGAYLITKDIEMSMYFANIASSVAISYPGVIAVDKSEILELIKNFEWDWYNNV